MRVWGGCGGRGMCCRHRTFLPSVFPTSRPPRKLRCSSPCNVYVQVGNASGETWPRSAQPAQSLLRCGIKLMARAVPETPILPFCSRQRPRFCFVVVVFSICCVCRYQISHASPTCLSETTQSLAADILHVYAFMYTTIVIYMIILYPLSCFYH